MNFTIILFYNDLIFNSVPSQKIRRPIYNQNYIKPSVLIRIPCLLLVLYLRCLARLHFYNMQLFTIGLLIVVFLIVSINLFVSLVIFIAEDYHLIDHVKIYELFEAKPYQRVRQQLMNNNYTILTGDDQTGVKNFIEHQANVHTLEGRPVVIKRYQSSSQEKLKLLKTVKETRFYMETALGIDRDERTEVFFIKSLDEFPTEEIEFIRQKYPSDNIIVVSERALSIKIKQFRTITFPPVQLKDLEGFMKDYLGMGKKAIAKVVRQNDGSVEKIFRYFKRRSVVEAEGVEQMVEVDDIEDLNEISHELAEKERKRLILKQKKKEGKKGKK